MSKTETLKEVTKMGRPIDEATALKAKEIKFQVPELDVLVVGTWIYVSGDSFPLRAKLIALGLHWSSDKRRWYFKPAGHFFKGKPKTYEAITDKYGELRVQTAPQVVLP